MPFRDAYSMIVVSVQLGSVIFSAVVDCYRELRSAIVNIMVVCSGRDCAVGTSLHSHVRVKVTVRVRLKG